MVVSSLSDTQVEALLAGAVPTNGDSAAVADVLNAVRAIAWTDSDVDFSGLFAAAARESRVTPIERFANEHVAPTKDWLPKVMPRVAIAGVALDSRAAAAKRPEKSTSESVQAIALTAFNTSATAAESPSVGSAPVRSAST